MKVTEQTLQQVERALRKISDKFPPNEEATMLTDIHIRVTQETGELVAYDDDDNEITRCIIEQWIDNKEDSFYNDAANTLRSVLAKHKQQVEQMSILKPYSFVLEDDDCEVSSPFIMRSISSSAFADVFRVKLLPLGSSGITKMPSSSLASAAALARSSST